MTDKIYTQLDNEGFAVDDGYITIHNFDSSTKEYRDTIDEWRAKGQGLPAHSTNIDLIDIKDGFARCFVNGKWKYITDNRGKTAYNKLDQSSVVISSLGDLNDDYTLVAPTDPCQSWDEKKGKWIKDKAKEDDALIKERENQKAILLQKIDIIIENQLDKLAFEGKSLEDDSVVTLRKFRYQIRIFDPKDLSQPVPELPVF